MPKRTFVYGAAILLGANLLNRVLGFVYQYLIMAYVGGEAYGLFNMVFPIYMMALVFTTAGIPLAVSKLVSEEITLGRTRQANKIFHLALFILTVSGTLVTILMYVLAPHLADRIFPDPRVLQVFLICTPAIAIVSIASAFRGYFQGLQNMVPTALSQICEQLVRVTVGFIMAIKLLPHGVEYGAAGLALGMLAGEAIGLIVIFINYQSARIKQTTSESQKLLSNKQIIKRLWHLASPVTLGRLLSTGLSALDAVLIPQRLQAAGYTARQATTLFGQLGGSAFTLLTFPSVFTFALSTSLVPAISEAAAKNEFHVVRLRSSEAIRLTIILGLPCLILLFHFSEPLTAFFKSVNIGPILRILAIGGIFSYLQQTTTGILQGLGKVHLPVFNSIIAAAIRVPILYTLTGMTQWGLTGSALAYIIGFFIMAVLNIGAIIKCTGMPIHLHHFVLQPLSASLGMLLVFRFLVPYTDAFILSYIEEIIVGLIVYIVILFINGGITMSDLRRIPGFNRVFRT